MFNSTNYKEAVLKAVNLGDDTDTVAAICGGLAGIYYGFDEIPIEWISEIRQIETIIDLCENNFRFFYNCIIFNLVKLIFFIKMF